MNKIEDNRIKGIKRKAKKISKEKNIPHSEALDFVSKEIGFNSFKHFMENIKNK